MPSRSPEANDPELVPMTIRGLMIDPATNHPIVILRHDDEATYLPIWIGVFEASAIQLELEGVQRSRPMTHDLIRSLLEQLEARVLKIVVSDLHEHTFLAEIHLERGSNGDRQHLVIDSRPSDALAIALRAKAPVFVARHVLAQAKAVEVTESEDAEEKVRKMLEELDPDDPGQYEM